jgi:hypothetical protein
MAKDKLIQDIKINPARYYRAPTDVGRDRRFNDAERLQILDAWERDARALSVASDEGMTGGEPTRLREVVEARAEIEKRVPGREDHRAHTSPTKFGSGHVD